MEIHGFYSQPSYSNPVSSFFTHLLWHHSPILTTVCQRFLLQLVSTLLLSPSFLYQFLQYPPIHLILCSFIYLTVSVCPINNSISSLVLTLQLPSCSLLSFQTLLIVVHVYLLVRRFHTHCNKDGHNFISEIKITTILKMEKMSERIFLNHL
jgi:hypothetical protein